MPKKPPLGVGGEENRGESTMKKKGAGYEDGWLCLLREKKEQERNSILIEDQAPPQVALHFELLSTNHHLGNIISNAEPARNNPSPKRSPASLCTPRLPEWRMLLAHPRRTPRPTMTMVWALFSTTCDSADKGRSSNLSREALGSELNPYFRRPLLFTIAVSQLQVRHQTRKPHRE